MAKFQLRHIIFILLGAIVVLLAFYFLQGQFYFIPALVVGILVAATPLWFDFLKESRRRKGMEEAFPDFVRNLVSSIRSGMPVAKAILHVSTVNYGPLDPYVKKLARQIEWDLPVRKALLMFSREVNSPLVTRTISTVIEAETAGGNIEDVLDSVTSSVLKVKRMKDIRKAGVTSSIVQSYVIFFVFLATMVIIQNLILPYVANIGTLSMTGEIQSGGFTTASEGLDFTNVSTFFTSLIAAATTFKGIILAITLIQGFFSGIILGKMAEGTFSAGFKHSVTLMLAAFLVIIMSQSLVL